MLHDHRPCVQPELRAVERLGTRRVRTDNGEEMPARHQLRRLHGFPGFVCSTLFVIDQHPDELLRPVFHLTPRRTTSRATLGIAAEVISGNDRSPALAASDQTFDVHRGHRQVRPSRIDLGRCRLNQHLGVHRRVARPIEPTSYREAPRPRLFPEPLVLPLGCGVERVRSRGRRQGARNLVCLQTIGMECNARALNEVDAP
mmetsp:Transcript_107179/g.271990  ORF Transcript_107179/g.271990 Transcript_107179/m.271990 type:complete len:201 (-) Transcript_107179:227-829(-)